MSASNGPSIVTNGLLFDYDMSNTQKSWKGAPTVNYVSNPTSEVIAGNEFAAYTDLSPTFDTYGEGYYSISADIKTAVPGSLTVYTASGGVEYDIGYYSAACETYYKRFYFNNINVTRTNPSQTVSNLSFYGGYGSGIKPSIKNVQVEKNSFCTPFVSGTRSNTQAILDLTNINTLTVSNLTYAADNTFSFNGSNSYIQTPITGSFPQISFDFWSFFDDPALNTYSREESILGDWNNGRIHFGTRWGGAGMHWNVNSIWEETPNTNLRYGWNHYSLVWNNNTNEKKVYINSILSSSSTTNGNIVLGDFKIGNATALNYYYRGKIGSFSIYGQAISAAEVKQNFNATRSRYGI